MGKRFESLVRVEDGPPERLCLSKSNDADYDAQLVALGEAPPPRARPGAAALSAFAGAMPAAKCARVAKSRVEE